MQDRRDQILEAARELMMSGGLGNASVRAVAQRAGLGASTLRYYFPTQAALHEELLRTLLQGQVADLRIADRRVPASQRLAECMWQFLPASQAEAQATGQAWLMTVQQALSPGHSGAGEGVAPVLFAQGRDVVLRWLEVLVEQGSTLRVGRGDAATLLLATADGLLLDLLNPTEPMDVQEARRLLRVLVDQLVPAGPQGGDTGC